MKIQKKDIIWWVLLLWIVWAQAFALNIESTIENVYSYFKKVILTVDGNPNSTQTIVLDG